MRRMKDRYSRQEFILGKARQEKLEKAKVAIVGVGALGCVSADLLSRAGVGHLTLIDRDIVEESNLQRQTLFSEEDIGLPKAEVASQRLSKVNSSIKISPQITDLNYQNAEALLQDHDLILDGTDNFYTRFLINDVSKKKGIPWIYAGALKEKGSLLVVREGAPCFRCVFEGRKARDTCETTGVIASISSCVASFQTYEAIKLLTGGSSESHLIHFTGRPLSLSKVKVSKKGSCQTCRHKFEYLEGRKESLISYQCSNLFQFTQEEVDIPTIHKRLAKVDIVRGNGRYLFFRNISLFENGRVLIRAKNEAEAKKILAKYVGS